MPVNAEKAQENFGHYQYARDNGHTDYVRKADKCERFYQAQQWDEAVRKKLERQGKPVLTINQTLATVALVQGELLNTIGEVVFKPSSNGIEETAHALSKVYKNVANHNRLYWMEQDVADDGFIGGRGFLDVRVQFDYNMLGEVVLSQLNPRNVVVDPDADTYDPDGWKEVFITRWMSPQDIALHYSEEDAKILKSRAKEDFMFGYDSIVESATSKNTFGDPLNQRNQAGAVVDSNLRRLIRVVERQYWKQRRRQFFVDRRTGDSKPVPENWNEQRMRDVAERYNLAIITRPYKQIRWMVTADNVVLHDAWSPYEHFTVVPYFPYFRRGETIGIVENLISPQEQLNKTASQELHIINTTANSGWKVKSGSLTNMTTEDLESRGGETGLVIEYNAADARAIEKIEPNQVPTGIDRVSTKSEGWIKTISGVSDSMRGFDREDVSGKAIEAKQQRGSMNLAKIFDNLNRTRHLVAERVKSCVQTYYTEPRVLRITGDRPSDEAEEIPINQPDTTGRLINDLTIGRYETVITTRPPRDSYDQMQFEQVVSLRRDLGVQIPDKTLIEMSDIENKHDVLRDMGVGEDSADRQRQMEQEQAERERAEAQAKIQRDQREAELAEARANKVQAEILEMQQFPKAQQEQQDKQHQMRIKQMEIEQQDRENQRQLELEREKHEEDLDFQQSKAQQEFRLRRMEIQQQREQNSAQQATGS